MPAITALARRYVAPQCLRTGNVRHRRRKPYSRADSAGDEAAGPTPGGNRTCYKPTMAGARPTHPAHCRREGVQGGDHQAGGNAPPKAPLSLPGVKEMVSLRIDRDVLYFFQEDGPGWQEIINAALRKGRASSADFPLSRLDDFQRDRREVGKP